MKTWDDYPPLQPFGAENQTLLKNVHPPDWVNPTPQPRYDLVVLGAGAAGLISAAGAAGLGAKVALIERELMGGDCLNVGCVPSKGLIRAARAWHAAATGKEFGAPTAETSGDFSIAMQRMRRLRAEISPVDGAERFRDLGIDVFLGEGRFLSPTQIGVGDQTLAFKRAVIATGARASIPPIPGLEKVHYRTNESIFSLEEKPERLAVIGAGPIGCEMAQGFARFGTEVTLLSRSEHILPREDADAARIIQESMTRDGVHLIYGARIERAEETDGQKKIFFQQKGSSKQVLCDEVLIATGRTPNLAGLDLDKAGVQADEKGVLVDDRLRTRNRRIFACGDICSKTKFTHTADAQARIVLRNALFRGRARNSDLVIPWVTYTSPEIAHVGLYQDEARKRGIETETITVPMREVDRALLDGEDEGFLRLHIRKGTDQILGATLVAEQAGSLIGELCLAISANVGLGRIANTIHPYPTQSEIVKKAADAWNRTRMTPRISQLLKTYFRFFFR